MKKNNNYCIWEKLDNFYDKTSCGTDIPCTLERYPYCPVCSKPIKIINYLKTKEIKL